MDATLVVVALIAAVPSTLAAVSARRTHNEVKTNHGVRAGERIENLNDDMAFLRRVIVTKSDLQAHADHDEEVAVLLAESVADTKQELLAAIGGSKP